MPEQIAITNVTVEQAHANAVGKGFWNGDNLGEKLCLVHSEISEGLEELRRPKRNMTAFGEEMADAVIRIMDICGYCGIDLVDAVLKKMAANRSRPAMHGKRF
jgi:NTP pyrophosphatase (non-canonical NTP hydrolase)